MPTTKKMPMGSSILLALYDARNRISAYDLDQAEAYYRMRLQKRLNCWHSLLCCGRITVRRDLSVHRTYQEMGHASRVVRS